MKSLFGVVFSIFLIIPICETVVYSWLMSLPKIDGDSPRSQNDTSRLLNQTSQKTYCTKDRQCGATNYCHRHYGICHKCKNVGAKCRRDHVCCKGLECVFGRCRTIVKKGNYLSRCRKDKDCKQGLCCAKSHGEFVCKPMLRENQICSVLEGGVAYTVNHGCPCDDGLVCTTQKRRRKGLKETHKLSLRRCKKKQPK
ncbi:dickkopf-related protein 4-like [Dendronephthya gigantea]|uniref:dickkopf-related protein 4-like n=1 Tax=Dendronephthya gigantea TaxID=151771 RepID=UPI00106C92A5|nr:dickkopf-related protein 4-like [Dendronephthya gigantea]